MIGIQPRFAISNPTIFMANHVFSDKCLNIRIATALETAGFSSVVTAPIHMNIERSLGAQSTFSVGARLPSTNLDSPEAKLAKSDGLVPKIPAGTFDSKVKNSVTNWLPNSPRVSAAIDKIIDIISDMSDLDESGGIPREERMAKRIAQKMEWASWTKDDIIEMLKSDKFAERHQGSERYTGLRAALIAGTVMGLKGDNCHDLRGFDTVADQIL